MICRLHSRLMLLAGFFLLQLVSTAHGMPKFKRENQPSLHLCSDSTAADYSPKVTPIQGFGHYLGDYLSINFHNHARGGRSTRSFINQGLWALLLEQLVPGDFVAIEMGHNDATRPGSEADKGRDRGVLRGVGDETMVVANTTGGKGTEVVYTFGHYLHRMIADVRQRKAIPILSGMVPTMAWSGGQLRTTWQFTEWARQTAASESAGFVDHTKYSVQSFQALGETKSMGMFPLDHTHTNAAGALLNAKAFVAAVKCGATADVRALSKRLNRLGNVAGRVRSC